MKRTGAHSKSPWRQPLLAAAILVALTLAVFWPLVGFPFVHWDDDVYVTGNARVQRGLSWDNVKWAFTTTYFGFYYPVTWLSHMLDCQLFGLRAGGHHATNILWHLFNVLALFAALRRMTGSLWRSFAVAALFAVHPLCVESVAWVSERKNLLSTFFWFAGLYLYARYAEKPNKTNYALVFASFVLGLMSKSMLVTFPFVLLLLDFWPLGRWASKTSAKGVKAAAVPLRPPASLKRLLIEKAPFAAVALVFCAVTYLAQKEASAVLSLRDITLPQRLANALITYITYVVRVLAPVHLAAYYQHPRAGVSYALAALCGAVLLAVTWVAWVGRRRGYLPVGWLWYLGTLVPVIGIVQVGGQSSADRYTYVPLVGLFAVAVWGAFDLVADRPSKVRVPAMVVGIVVLGALATRAYAQVFTWRDSRVLFTNALRISPDAGVLNYNMGMVYDSEDRREEAIAFYRKAVELSPKRGNAWNNLGVDLAKSGDQRKALEAFERADKLLDDNAPVKFNIGNCHEELGENEAAQASYAEDLAVNPSHAKAWAHSGIVLEKLGRWKEAAAAYERACQLLPDDPIPFLGLSRVYQDLGRPQEAVKVGLEAMKLDPKSADACAGLGTLCAELKMWPEARDVFVKAVSINPGVAENWAYLALACQNLKQTDKAIQAYEEAVRLNPALVICRFNLGILYLKKGDRASAMSQCQILQKLDPDLAQKLRGFIQAVR